MRVIFLDFDGVLNCYRSFERDRSPVSLWDPNLECLARLVKHSGARVVISSSWRYFYPIEELTMALWAYGVDCEVLGRTVCRFGSLPRGLEIQEWLDENPGVEFFCILDDEGDMEHLAPYLVRTSMETGLTDTHVAQALSLLGHAEASA